MPIGMLIMTGNKLRCCKCFITLEHLKKTGIDDYLIRIVLEDGKEDYICSVCQKGW
jgi:hypothetical protein